MDPGLIFLGVAFVIMVMMFQRTNRQRREIAQVQEKIAPGSEVMTASGLYATVLDVAGDRVTLQTGPGQTSVWDRRAVARIVTAGPQVDEADEAKEPGSGKNPEAP